MIGKVSVKTTYAGLNISNPLVVSSSWLTNSVDNVLRLEKAGIGAIVLKSLFEEQIRSESEELIRVSSYSVADEYITAYTRVGLIAEYTALALEDPCPLITGYLVPSSSAPPYSV